MRKRLPRRSGSLPANWRFAFVSASLLGTMTLTAIAAYRLHVSILAHEEAVERALGEYARYASRTFGEAVLRHGVGTATEVMAAPTIITAEPGRGMTVDEFAEHATRALVSHEVGVGTWTGFLRYDLATGTLQTSGAAARPDVAAAALEVVRAQLDQGDVAESKAVLRFDVDGEPLSLSLAAQRTRDGVPVYLFGYVNARRETAAAQTHWVISRIPLLPYVDEVDGVLSLPAPRTGHGRLPAAHLAAAPLYGDPVANDSVVSIEFLDDAGRLLYATPHQFDTQVSGEFIFRTRSGGFTIRSTLSPRVVNEFRTLNRPDRDGHYAILLPLLALLLGASALVHLLRERELVHTRRNFVASVSHELRTPLAQIQILAETLQRGRERSDEERRRWLGVIAREAYRMGGLVENILMFSHLERDELRLVREPTDVRELVDDLVDSFAPLTAARNATIHVSIPDGLLADVDPGALRQVLGNLLDNALKYGPAGQTVRIAATATASSQICISMEDQGPGIPPHERESVWRPFHRLTHSNGSAGGSGLGLSVVRSLVAHHGGSVSIDDAPGGGARFSVSVPRVSHGGEPPPAGRQAVTDVVPAGEPY